MEQAGATREALKTGDPIIVTGNRRKDTKLLILPRAIRQSGMSRSQFES